MAKNRIRPEKPTPDFPLFPHTCGQWAKRICNKIWYFGRWEDRDAALRRYLDEKFEIQQGRVPRSRQAQPENLNGLTIRDLANQFLTSQERRRDDREISERSFAEYFQACRRILEFFGRDMMVESVKASDFRSFRSSWPKTWGLQMQSDMIAKTTTVFTYAAKNGLVTTTIVFGTDFKKPSRQQMRKVKQQRVVENGSTDFTAEQCRLLLSEKSPVLRACILLGLNCGFGNTDCADMTERVLDLENGWVDYPRPKTGIPRRCWLWPETVVAIRAAMEVRPVAFERQHLGLCFLTSKGRPLVWHTVKGGKHCQTNNVTTAFSKLLKRLEIRRPGVGFYSLRRTFETVAGGSKDQVAVDCVMGHLDASMAAVYRQTIEDTRLRDVSQHVWRWLYPE